MKDDDYELVKWAAKAAGLQSTKSTLRGLRDFYYRPGTLLQVWAPLLCGSDALWLAVKLRIKFEVHTAHPFVAAFAPDIAGRFEEEVLNGDEMEATRRAIVRAAAEIGRNLP